METNIDMETMNMEWKRIWKFPYSEETFSTDFNQSELPVINALPPNSGNSFTSVILSERLGLTICRCTPSSAQVFVVTLLFVLMQYFL